MARSKKLRKIGCHTEEQMKAALKLVWSGKSIRSAAKLKGIAYPTLRRYYANTKNINEGEHVRLTPNYNINQIFSSEQEETLLKYLTDCAYTFYGLTNVDCRKLAYETAKINNINIPDSWKRDKIAGIEWLRSFRNRHSRLTLRAPEKCSLARATAFNRHNIEKYFDNLADVLKRNPRFADGTRIYNLDETATTTVQRPQKVIAPKGIRCLSKVSSGEKGTLTTTCAIICTSGQSLPPVIIFPRKNFKNFMVKGTPPGTLGLATSSGWMNTELFPQVMKHFIKHSSSTIENPSLLILDNHESHLSIEALEMAKSNGVTILTIYPHCSHKTQPLDVGIFKPFKDCYNASMESWLMNHPGEPVTIYDLGAFIGEAYVKALTPLSITNAFKKTGIFPFNRSVFTEIDFLPSTVTDRSDPTILGEINTNSRSAVECNTDNVTNGTPNDIEQKNIQPPENSSQNLSRDTETLQNELQKTNLGQFISPFDFRPPLKAQPQKKFRKNRKKGRSLIANDTPEKGEIARESEEKKRRLELKKNAVKKSTKKTARKVLQESSTSESDSSMILESDDAVTDDEEPGGENVPIVKQQLGQLRRDAIEGDFILVEFQGKKDFVYYVAKILEVHDSEYDVSYFRRKLSMQYMFTLPDVPDLATVSKYDVKVILPDPMEHGSTSRLQNSYSFNVDFSGLNIR